MTITATEARKNLFPLIDQVNDSRQPVEIRSRRSTAVLVAKEDFDSLQEEAHLLRSPANARRLFEAIEEVEAGKIEQHDLIKDGE